VALADHLEAAEVSLVAAVAVAGVCSVAAEKQQGTSNPDSKTDGAQKGNPLQEQRKAEGSSQKSQSQQAKVRKGKMPKGRMQREKMRRKEQGLGQQQVEWVVEPW
jgi:hypothetical protein